MVVLKECTFPITGLQSPLWAVSVAYARLASPQSALPLCQHLSGITANDRGSSNGFCDDPPPPRLIGSYCSYPVPATHEFHSRACRQLRLVLLASKLAFTSFSCLFLLTWLVLNRHIVTRSTFFCATSDLFNLFTHPPTLSLICLRYLSIVTSVEHARARGIFVSFAFSYLVSGNSPVRVSCLTRHFFIAA